MTTREKFADNDLLSDRTLNNNSIIIINVPMVVMKNVQSGILCYTNSDKSNFSDCRHISALSSFFIT